MITLITGVPGSGKTLFGLVHVKTIAEKSGRAVYQNGINELTLPWEVMGDVEKWHKLLPTGAILVLDECQRAFRPRGTGAAVPDFVQALETHRHQGQDLVLITQHPMLIDSNVRRLVGQHFHVVRKFGTGFATVHEWPSCKEVSKATIADSIRHEFKYPREAFTWYKSAEVHTQKRRIPMRVWFLLSSPFLLGGLAWWGYSKVSHLGESVVSPITAAKATPRAGTPDSPPLGSGPVSARQYVNSQVPRVAALAYTAPVYDAVTTIQRAPVPVACVQGPKECRCYSQDATRMSVPESLCADIVRDGFFVPFEVKNAASARVESDRGTPGPVKGRSDPVPRSMPSSEPLPAKPVLLPVAPSVDRATLKGAS